MKIQTVLKETYIISAENCTPDEVAEILNRIARPDCRQWNPIIEQEFKYDCEGYGEPTGLYTVSAVATCTKYDQRNKVLSWYTPEDLAVFGINKND